MSVVAMSTMLFSANAQTEIKVYDACDTNQNGTVTVDDGVNVVNHYVSSTASTGVVTAEQLNELLKNSNTKYEEIISRLSAIETKLGISTPGSPSAPSVSASFPASRKALKVGETFTQAVETTSEGAVKYYSTNPSVATVDAATGLVTAVALGETTILVSIAATSSTPAVSAAYTVYVEASNIHNGYEYVDLGVVVDGKKILWATTNIGAELPADYGDYYAWGETETKSSYYESDYKYYSKDGVEDEDGFIVGAGYYVNIGSDISGTQYDVAHVKWQGDWCMPSSDEWDALDSQCDWAWVQMRNTKGDAVNGYKVSKKGDSKTYIFLPAAGCRDSSSLYLAGSYGYYWSSSIYISYDAYICYFNSSSHYTDNSLRYYGRSVRPVLRQ